MMAYQVESVDALPPIPDPRPYADFAAGLVYGLTGDNHLEEIQTCFDAGDDMAKDAQAALADVKAGHFIKGLKDLGSIVWDLPNAFSDCTGMDEDIAAIQEWAVIFKNPVALSKIAGKNWLVHGTEIKEDITQEQADWAEGNYFEAGEDSADALVTLLGPIEPANGLVLPPLPDKVSLAKFAAGLIYGLTDHNHLDEIEQCMNAGKPMADAAFAAVMDFKEKKIIEGLSEVGKVLDGLPDAFSDCTGMDEDIAAIEEWAVIFKSPLKLTQTATKNILLNGPEIAADIQKQKLDWQSGDYYEAGEDVADVLVMIVGPVETSTLKSLPVMDDREVQALFTSGIFWELTGHNPLDELRKCLNVTKPMVGAAPRAIADLKDKKILQGLSQIGTLFQELPEACASCKGMDEDIAAIVEWSAILKQPMELAKISAEPLLHHGAEINQDLNKMYEDYRSRYFFEAGEDTADFVVQIIGPIKPEAAF